MTFRAPRTLIAIVASVCGLLGCVGLVFAQATPRPADVTLAQTGGPEATMVGFRKTGEGSALVYVQLTESVQVRSKEEGKTLVFTMKGTSVPKKNNRNPLVTNHFGSVVDRIRLVPSGKDTDLVIELRLKARSSVQVVRLGDGAVLEVHLTADEKAEPKAAVADPRP